MNQENLPIHLDTERDVGSISYANDVIAIIAGMAANEVEGVLTTTGTSSIADLFGRSKPVTRGVKVEVGVEEASVDLVVTIEYGKPIQKVCIEVQEGVRKAIETMTGLKVLRVDVHVIGVSFEKETQEMAKGYVRATEAGALPQEAKPDATKPVAQARPEAAFEDDFDVAIPDEDEQEPEQEDDPEAEAVECVTDVIEGVDDAPVGATEEE